MATTETNNYAKAMSAIHATPVGEAGEYESIAFFRNRKNQITVILDAQQQHFPNDAAAAELVWLVLQRD
jgi:hypothetical protein